MNVYLNAFLLASVGEPDMQDIWSVKKKESKDIVIVLQKQLHLAIVSTGFVLSSHIYARLLVFQAKSTSCSIYIHTICA